MAPGARSKFGAPMFEPKVFRKKMCCIEESACDIVGIFRRPGSDLAPHSDSAAGKLYSPSLRPWLCSTWLKPCSATYVVGNTSSNKANFLKTHTALDANLTICVNKIWHRLDHHFGSRWKALDVELHSLMSVLGKNALHPVTFYAIQLSAVSSRQKDFLACLKLQVAKNIFWNS